MGSHLVPHAPHAFMHRFQVTATFVASGGAPRGQHLEILLPLCLFAMLVPPVKNAGKEV